MVLLSLIIRSISNSLFCMKNNVSPNDLQVFLTVLNEGGFRAAAKRLGIAPSKVSTTVSRIEKQLGVPLLLRTTRSLRATDQGHRLAERIRPLMTEMDAACFEAANSADHIQGHLRLNVPGAVVPDILPPLIVELQRRHPKVQVEIVVENSLVDIIAAGCDAGIRYGDSIQKDMITLPIGPRLQQIALAASPSYVKQHGLPRDPQELTDHRAIRYRLPDGMLIPWSLRRGDETANIVEFTTSLVLSVNALNAGLNYVRAGLGIIGTFRNWLESDFRAGTLTPVLPDWWAELEGPRLYYPSRFTSSALRAFIDVCRSEATTV
ncbi:DNA-binding transcriptional LysR family regulator [Rhizobium sp. BK529]|uniref:LysR family transcriptional regulator n=1 Tax=Rhizobium sp. BK529 TaxID=2586983 RepID=UPI00180DC789|nr:LysR family transcriptional regulator [Rhizobium sp. BK529]MBB3590748.1 DNA-binding transcriptional LysR family regulator [Rhizobium sp. BK529]